MLPSSSSVDNHLKSLATHDRNLEKGGQCGPGAAACAQQPYLLAMNNVAGLADTVTSCIPNTLEVSVCRGRPRLGKPVKRPETNRQQVEQGFACLQVPPRGQARIVMANTDALQLPNIGKQLKHVGTPPLEVFCAVV